MTAELGGIKIVPRPSSNTIKISGPKSCVEEFKNKMEVMIDDIKAQVGNFLVLKSTVVTFVFYKKN